LPCRNTFRLAPRGNCISQGIAYLKAILIKVLRNLSFVEVAGSGGDERVYRTGDVASYGMDGLLRYWGRNDDQIKIRGFCVERDEVGRAIERIPGVREAYVAKMQDTKHEFLAAYLVPEPDASLAIETVREALRSELPHYMIADELRVLQKGLPLNRNGKVASAA
jgi:iturin family lipopeptide synthetase A